MPNSMDGSMYGSAIIMRIAACFAVCFKSTLCDAIAFVNAIAHAALEVRAVDRMPCIVALASHAVRHATQHAQLLHRLVDD